MEQKAEKSDTELKRIKQIREEKIPVLKKENEELKEKNENLQQNNTDLQRENKELKTQNEFLELALYTKSKEYRTIIDVKTSLNNMDNMLTQMESLIKYVDENTDLHNNEMSECVFGEAENTYIQNSLNKISKDLKQFNTQSTNSLLHNQHEALQEMSNDMVSINPNSLQLNN